MTVPNFVKERLNEGDIDDSTKAIDAAIFAPFEDTDELADDLAVRQDEPTDEVNVIDTGLEAELEEPVEGLE